LSQDQEAKYWSRNAENDWNETNLHKVSHVFISCLFSWWGEQICVFNKLFWCLWWYGL